MEKNNDTGEEGRVQVEGMERVTGSRMCIQDSVAETVRQRDVSACHTVWVALAATSLG